jgi:hypothetical protein
MFLAVQALVTYSLNRPALHPNRKERRFSDPPQVSSDLPNQRGSYGIGCLTEDAGFHEAASIGERAFSTYTVNEFFIDVAFWVGSVIDW